MVLSYSTLFMVFIVLHGVANGQLRTKKASKTALKRIQLLLNAEVQKSVAQDDATFLTDASLTPARRDPSMKHSHSELDVNRDQLEDYFQGDVELSEEQATILQEQLTAGNSHSKSTADALRRTKRKIGRTKGISYDFAESIPPATKVKIREALGIWERGTCLRFMERGVDVDRLEFFDGGGCSSFVGRTGGTQGISISTPGCDHVGIVAHEVGHAIGTFHEQARPDQQTYLAVHYGNIPLSRWNNFHPLADNQAHTFNLPFDAGSVMMYGPYGFAADPFRPTISTLDKNHQSTIGQRLSGPSFLDIQAINEAYSCNENCKTTIKVRCHHGGYQDSKDCRRCICPDGFGGQFCESPARTSCGGHVQVSSNYSLLINSPNYPSNFPAGESCVWLLKSMSALPIQLQFIETFNYQCEDTCDKSFVELKAGPDFRPTGYRFCCSLLPSQRFESHGDEMVVIHSARGESSVGFRVRVWTSLNGSAPPPSLRETLPPSPSSTSTPAPVSEVTSIVVTSTATSPTALPSTTKQPLVLPFATLLPTLSPLFPGIQTTPTPLTLSTNTAPPNPELNGCTCDQWTEWSDCSQLCGGCGRRSRRRECSPPAQLCQREERRACNFTSCPQGANFLFNNAEFHFLWRGCCVGLFKNGNQCSALDNGENAFFKLLSSLLSAQDSRNRNKTESNYIRVARKEH